MPYQPNDPREALRDLDDDDSPGEANDPGELGEWDYADEADEIPPRGWLLGNLLCRQFLTGIVGDGATGKTALLIAMALSLVTGRSDLLDEHVFERCNVLLLCFEDGEAELRRRLRAARIYYNISKDDCRGRLFIKAINRSDLKLAVQGHDGVKLGVLAGALERAILRRHADVVLLDPLVKTHGVSENDNAAMDFVAGILTDIAIRHNSAGCTPQHTRKGLPDPGNADAGRGAGSLKDAFRLCYTLTKAQAEDGARFAISDEERAALVRLDFGKVNLVANDPNARWLQLVGVPLGNKAELYPHGDNVQTIRRWTPPDLFAGGDQTWNAVLDDIDKGMENRQRYSSDGPATKRAAWKVVTKHIDRNEKQARAIINAWLKSGLLINVDYDDPIERKLRKGLIVDATKRPGCQT
jgi:hypothetical protein